MEEHLVGLKRYSRALINLGQQHYAVSLYMSNHALTPQIASAEIVGGVIVHLERGLISDGRKLVYEAFEGRCWRDKLWRCCLLRLEKLQMVVLKVS